MRQYFLFFQMENNAIPKVFLHKLRQGHRDRAFHFACDQWIACFCAMDSMTAYKTFPVKAWALVREVLVWKQAHRDPGWFLALGSGVCTWNVLQQSSPASVHLAFGAGVAASHAVLFLPWASWEKLLLAQKSLWLPSFTEAWSSVMVKEVGLPARNVFINSDGKFCIVESHKVCICHRIKGGQFNSDMHVYMDSVEGEWASGWVGAVSVIFKILSNSTSINAEWDGLGEGELWALKAEEL